jgi:hypothetical protein
LRRHVTLQRCAEECAKRNTCSGIEYWEKDPSGEYRDAYANCFKCATNPRKKYGVVAIDVSMLSKSQRGNWADVYVKERNIPNKDLGNNLILIL